VNYVRRDQYRRLPRAGRLGLAGTAAAVLGLLAVRDDVAWPGALPLVVGVMLGLRARHWLSLAGRSGTGARSENEVRRALTPLQEHGWSVGHAHTVTIDWGDGQTSPRAVDGAANVSAPHTDASAGTYSATMTVTDEGGQNAHATVIASISAPSPPPCVSTTPIAASPFTPTAASPDTRWVQAPDHDLLGRPADGRRAGGVFRGAQWRSDP
jgi:hypothetical protein